MPHTTSLTQIREFLEAEGCAPEPWSSPEAALQRLYDLLVERRDDERFWARLKELARELDSSRFDPRALPEFETLGSAAVDRLIDDLRRSVGDRDGDSGRRTLRQWMSGSAGMAAVAFILLGISLSCDPDDEPRVEPSWTVDNWTCEEQADYYAIDDADDRDCLCALGEYIKASDLYTHNKNLMLDCLPDLDSSYRLELLDQFQNATAEELNRILIDMVEYGECQEDYSGSYGGGCGFH